MTYFYVNEGEFLITVHCISIQTRQLFFYGSYVTLHYRVEYTYTQFVPYCYCYPAKTILFISNNYKHIFFLTWAQLSRFEIRWRTDLRWFHSWSFDKSIITLRRFLTRISWWRIYWWVCLWLMNYSYISRNVRNGSENELKWVRLYI